MRKNRKYTPEFKIECVKEYLNDNISQNKICKKHLIARSVFEKWLSQYGENGEAYFYEEHRGKHGSCNPYAALHRKKNLSKEERLELENLKLRIENERLKKGYIVEGVGADKEFVTSKDVNTKS